MERRYQYNCVTPASLEELEYIIEEMEYISYEDFVTNLQSPDLADLKESLGYVKGSLPTLKTDWAVRFAKCYLPEKQKTAYVLIHSAIEHVFY